jgi:molybdenum cofactor cytidylyltransferase
VLAAGGSTRLGTPKQLIVYEGRTLLRRAVETALTAASTTAAGPTRCGSVAVVLGAEAERMRAELVGLAALVVHNADWQEGLSTSLRAGLEALESQATGDRPLDAVLITTCDQPHVTPATLRAVLAVYDAARPPVVACAYAGAVGVPALFDRALFTELRALRGDAGAKRVIESHRAALVMVPAPEAALDVDTALDARRLADGEPGS